MTISSLKNLCLNQIYLNYLPPNTKNYTNLKKLIIEMEIPIELLILLVNLHWGNLFFIYLRYPFIDYQFICKMLELDAPIGDQWSKMRIYYILNKNNINNTYNNLLGILKPYVNVDIEYIYNNLFTDRNDPRSNDLDYINEKKDLINDMFNNLYTYNGDYDIYKITNDQINKIIKSSKPRQNVTESYTEYVKEYLTYILSEYLDSTTKFNDINLQILTNTDSMLTIYSAELISYIFMLGNIFYLDKLIVEFNNKLNLSNYFIKFKFNLNMKFVEYYLNNLYINKKNNILNYIFTYYTNPFDLDKDYIPLLIKTKYNELINYYKQKVGN